MRYLAIYASNKHKTGVSVYGYLWPVDSDRPSPCGMTVASEDTLTEAYERVRDDLTKWPNVIDHSEVQRVSDILGRNFCFGHDFRSTYNPKG